MCGYGPVGNADHYRSSPSTGRRASHRLLLPKGGGGGVGGAWVVTATLQPESMEGSIPYPEWEPQSTCTRA